MKYQLKQIITILLLLNSLTPQAQNVQLYQAKKGDFTIITGKHFEVIKDNGESFKQKWMYEFFYVDEISMDPDSLLSSVHLTNGEELQFTVNFSEGKTNFYDELARKNSIMVCDTCDPKGMYVKYICNDSLSPWSTHSSRPFIYGFNYTKQQCKQFIPEIEFMELKLGQKVAGIGSASGWYEGAISVNTEGIHYTIEDINKKLLNQKQFDAVVKHFSSVREGEQTNTFNFVLGNYDSTKLPEKTYDRIIMRNAYHEFTSKWKMIHDLKSKLAPGGKIVILDESFSSLYYTNFHSGCNVRGLQVKEVIRFFSEQGLYLVKMDLPTNSLDNSLMFSMDKKESEEYLNSLKKVDEIIFKVDRLNTSAYASNENYIDEVEILLKNNLNEIQTTYDSLHYYLSDIGSIWADEEKYEYALPILNMSNNLYPNIAFTNFYLGITHYGLEDRAQGDIYFEKAIALDKEQKEAVEEFKKAWIEWWGGVK